jgi:hypothetical protein
MKDPAAKFAMEPEAVAEAIAFAIEQPEDFNIGEIVLRSTAQPWVFALFQGESRDVEARGGLVHIDHLLPIADG